MAATFQRFHGYWRGLLTGYYQALLQPMDYERLSNAKNLDEVKFQLADTSLGTFMDSITGTPGIQDIARCLRARLTADFDHLRANVGCPVADRFMKFVQIAKVIDNLIIVIQGCNSREDVLADCDPMGIIPELGILAGLGTADGTNLQLSVLYGSLLGPWLADFITSHPKLVSGRADLDDSAGLKNPHILEELRHTLYKRWIEEFLRFCETETDGKTCSIMTDILSFEADLRTLGIVLNTIPRMADSDTQKQTEVLREKLFPAAGKFYPDSFMTLRDAQDVESVRTLVSLQYPGSSLLRSLADPSEEGNLPTFEDMAFAELYKKLDLANIQHYHLGSVYCWFKIREQEIRNIIWICESVVMMRSNSHTGLPGASPSFEAIN